jgi:golgi apyrase
MTFWPCQNSRRRKNGPRKHIQVRGLFYGLSNEIGISTFGDKPQSVGPNHLKPLLDHALKQVPDDQIEDTPFFLLATAGMRLLPDSQRTAVLEEVCSYVKTHTKFLLPDCDLHVQVIPGETEGLYGWIAANYLLEGFDKPEEHNHGKGHHTYGFLDMGGASAQIAFAPNATETEKHADNLKLLRLRKLNGMDQEFRVFVTTWLGFGANQARHRYVQSLQDKHGAQLMELPDPCIPTGLKVTLDGKPLTLSSSEQHLIGTGDFAACLKAAYPLLEKDKPCHDDPCLLGGVHAPAIDFDVNHFVGVSEYWHTTHGIFELQHDDKAYDFQTYQTRVNEFCSLPWSDIAKSVKKHKWGKKVDEIEAEEVCFKASWLINMLHEGIGIPRVGIEASTDSHNTSKELIHSAKSKGFLDPFQAVNKIEGVEVSWTLGKMILYASSQVPPAENALPVGFGSNSPGVSMPADFQRPGGLEVTKGSNETPEYDADDWTDILLDDSPKRIPGILLFMLIICVAVYYLCGRERRKAILSRFCSFLGCGKKSGYGGRGPFGQIFGVSPHKYDRVDGGEAGLTADDELDILPGASNYYDSDESTGEGRASGWATPKMGDVAAADGAGAGSPGKRQMFREGLMERAESKDSLVNVAKRLDAAGSRSRSPATFAFNKTKGTD